MTVPPPAPGDFARHLLVVTTPALWPAWPFLPVTRTARGAAELGVMLDARGLAYQLVDLTEDTAAMEMVTQLGYRQAPVVVAGDSHWAGFRPDMIGRLA